MYEEERTRKALIAVVFMVAFTSNIIWPALTSILLALSVLIGVFLVVPDWQGRNVMPSSNQGHLGGNQPR